MATLLMLTFSQSTIDQLIQLSRQASEAILSVYHSSSFDHSLKSDQSPLTEADIASHNILTAGLKAIWPEIPILSEESDKIPFAERQQWSTYWLIDPLDGTKEFIDRNGEFTVNIALIQDHKPVFGLIMVPVTGVCYWGGSDMGAYRIDDGSVCQPLSIATRVLGDLPSKDQPLSQITIVASRSHGGDEKTPLDAGLAAYTESVRYQKAGSSLKFCLVAEGLADIYPRLAPTCEWDTAAGQAIVEAVGGVVLNQECQPLRYNTKESLLNPYFYVIGDPSFPWIHLIKPR